MSRPTVPAASADSVGAPTSGIADAAVGTTETDLELPEAYQGQYLTLQFYDNAATNHDAYFVFNTATGVAMVGLVGGSDAGIAAGVGTDTAAVPFIAKDGQPISVVCPRPSGARKVILRYRMVSAAAGSMRVRVG